MLDAAFYTNRPDSRILFMVSIIIMHLFHLPLAAAAENLYEKLANL